ncbi:MAG TPA: helix-turn-helix domain-containing protein, partial [Candidatus Baltobacteraceae bacterium]|nr:helix-turn-helix domain-containing protein [Candidatus Baltobacteraceae bacterium]
MPLLGIAVDQLEPGDLRIERTTIPFPELTLRRTRANLGIRAAGDMLGKSTVVALVGDDTDARWSGAAFDRGSVASSRSRVDLLTRGPATLYTIAVGSDALPREFVSFDPQRANRLRRFLEGLAGAAERDGCETATRRSAGRTIVNFLSLLGDGESGRRLPEPRRVAAVRRCEEYVFDHIDENPTLAQLANVSGLGMRSLINAFRAVTGYSPMAFLKAQRLNAVHRALNVADPAETRVIDVATNWGFWHMGH